MNIKKNVFVERLVRHWNDLPRKVGEFPSPEVYQTQMWCLGTSFTGGHAGVKLMVGLDHKVIFQLN